MSEETVRLQTLNSLKILDTPQEKRFARLTRLAQRLFNVPIALVSLIDEHRVWVEREPGLESLELPSTASLYERALACDTVFVLEDASEDRSFSGSPEGTETPEIRFCAACPVRAPDGSRVGALYVLDTVPRRMTPQDIDLLSDVGQMVESELSALTMATTDELTKLANRRGFRMIAEPLLAVCRRIWNRPIAVTIVDIDGLKQINDESGHEAGDSVIRDFARLLLKVYRDSDVIARIGGDEFCVLLPSVDDADAASPLERLQHRVDSFNAESARPYELSFSAGMVTFDAERHANVDDLLRDADERMYAEKRAKVARQTSSTDAAGTADREKLHS